MWCKPVIPWYCKHKIAYFYHQYQYYVTFATCVGFARNRKWFNFGGKGKPLSLSKLLFEIIDILAFCAFLLCVYEIFTSRRLGHRLVSVKKNKKRRSYFCFLVSYSFIICLVLNSNLTCKFCLQFLLVIFYLQILLENFTWKFYLQNFTCKFC